jgi:hypothetical protein
MIGSRFASSKQLVDISAAVRVSAFLRSFPFCRKFPFLEVAETRAKRAGAFSTFYKMDHFVES